MTKRGRSGDPVEAEGMYICADGCERRYYRAGESFHTCQMHGGETEWLQVMEQ